MSAPFTPEEIYKSLAHFVESGAYQRVHVATRYGVELPFDELWTNSDTKTVHISIRIPEGYDLVKLEPRKP